MVASDFDGLGGYRTLVYEGQTLTQPYNCCFSRVFQASVCIATYGLSVPSLHTVYRLCDIALYTNSSLMNMCCTSRFHAGEIIELIYVGNGSHTEFFAPSLKAKSVVSACMV